MKALEDVDVSRVQLGELFTKQQVVIPAYQREYDWTTEQVRAFFDDAVAELVDGGGANWLGTLIVVQEGKTEMSVVDGQQRLTTAFILLAACRDMLSALDAALFHSEINEINRLLLGSRDGEDYCRIESQHVEANDALRALATGVAFSGSRPPVSNYVTAKQLLDACLHDRFKSGKDVADFARLLVGRTGFCRTAAKADAAAEIYLRTNDRGMALNTLDKLKARLYSSTLPHDRERFVELFHSVLKQVWRSGESGDRVLLHLGTGLHLKKESLKRCLDTITERAVATGVLAYLENTLLPAATAYANIALGYRPDGTLCPALDDVVALSRLSKFKGYRPVLVAARDLAAADFDRLAAELRDTLFVLSVAVASPPENEKVFADWAELFRSDGLDPVLPAIGAHRRRSSGDFWSHFGSYTYGDLGGRGLRFLFGRLEQHLTTTVQGLTPSNKGAISQFSAPDYEIEHVLPRARKTSAGFADCAAVVERIPNLTLLEASINASIKDKAHEAKLVGYGASKITLTLSMSRTIDGGGKNSGPAKAQRLLSTFPTWDDDALNRRNALLNDLIAAVFGLDNATVSTAASPASTMPLRLPQGRPGNSMRALQALAHGAFTKDTLAQLLDGKTGLESDSRQADYVFDTLTFFGLIEKSGEVMELSDFGAEIAAAGGEAEIRAALSEVFSQMLARDRRLAQIVAEPDPKRATALAAEFSRLAASTAGHRAGALRSWGKYLAGDAKAAEDPTLD